MRTASDVATMSSVTGMLKITILTYSTLTIAHLYVLPYPTNWIMSACAGISTILLGAMMLTIQILQGKEPQRFNRTYHKYGQPVVSVALAILLVNCTAHQFFHRKIQESTNFMLYYY